MQSGLPVLASINRGNDLAQTIENARVGRVCVNHSADVLQKLALELVDDISLDGAMASRCKALFADLFSPVIAARQIVTALAH
jgi:hypothetical protein